MENKEKLRVIFLDIDGVLSHYKSRWNIDPQKVALLEEILKSTGAKIVVSSSWRVGCRDGKDFVDKMFSTWRSELNSQKRDSLFIESIIDVTDHMGRERGDEIQRWLDAHEDEVETYVILDDDNDMLEEQLFNFVQTDGWYGMSDRTVELATQILNGEKIINPIRLNTELLTKWRLKRAGVQTNIESLLMDYNNKVK